MTKREAIEILKFNRDMCLFNPETGEESPMNEECKISAESFGVAISALEKQVPKKPILCGDEYSPNAWECPVCNHCKGYNSNYCPECGQKIDWGAEE